MLQAAPSWHSTASSVTFAAALPFVLEGVIVEEIGVEPTLTVLQTAALPLELLFHKIVRHLAVLMVASLPRQPDDLLLVRSFVIHHQANGA